MDKSNGPVSFFFLSRLMYKNFHKKYNIMEAEYFGQVHQIPTELLGKLSCTSKKVFESLFLLLDL